VLGGSGRFLGSRGVHGGVGWGWQQWQEAVASKLISMSVSVGTKKEESTYILEVML
jgi:hypothetical protein